MTPIEPLEKLRSPKVVRSFIPYNIHLLAIKILFILVLWKASGVRPWPHAYAGEIYQASRFIYLPDQFISLAALALLAMHFAEVWVILRTHALVFAFALFALLIRFIPFSENTTTLLTALSYWDVLISFALMIAMRGPNETRDLLTRFGILFIFANLASLAVPSTSMMINNFSGYARGLTAHRNDLAHITTASIFFILCSPAKLSSVIKWSSLLGGLILIGLAGSVQGIFLVAGGIFLYLIAPYSRILRSPFSILTYVIAVCLIGTLWNFFSLEDLLQPFGRDATFTGRDRIWGLSLYLIERMPWSGYGIGGIGSEVTPLSLLQSFQLGISFGTAHNSYLEAILAFGWIGGIVFFLAVLLETFRIVPDYFKRSDRQESLPILLLLICVVGGFTASEKMLLPGFGWLTFVAAAMLCHYPVKAGTK